MKGWSVIALLLLTSPALAATQVEQGRYQTSKAFVEMGVVSGHDMTMEAAITKLMFLFGQGLGEEEVMQRMGTAICGEVLVS